MPVVRKVDNAIHRINHYPVDSVVCFVNSYPLDSDLYVDSVIQPLNNRDLGVSETSRLVSGNAMTCDVHFYLYIIQLLYPWKV